jgi:phosphoribosylanthranilate isomerase
VHLRVKICGVTTERDACLAAEAGADAVGVNFFPPSPRYVADAAQVRRIAAALPPFTEAVGVFVRETWREACARALRCRLRAVQMHGDRHEYGRRLSLRRIDAFRVGDADGLRQVAQYLERAKDEDLLPNAVLIDACVPGHYGGTGHRPPWDLLANIRPAVPLFLAGGLTPENVGEAVRVVRPYGVDVASGVESAPGRKDADRVRRFIGEAREAAARLSG